MLDSFTQIKMNLLLIDTMQR